MTMKRYVQYLYAIFAQWARTLSTLGLQHIGRSTDMEHEYGYMDEYVFMRILTHALWARRIFQAFDEVVWRSMKIGKRMFWVARVKV